MRHMVLDVRNDSILGCVGTRGRGNGSIGLKAGRNICVTGMSRSNGNTTTKLGRNSIVAGMSNGGIAGVTRLRRSLGNGHPNSGVDVACLHGGGRAAGAVALGGTRNGASMVGDTSLSILNKAFHPIARDRGGRLDVGCNMRIVGIGDNTLGSTNTSHKFVVRHVGSDGVASLSSLRGTIGDTSADGSPILCVRNM